MEISKKYVNDKQNYDILMKNINIDISEQLKEQQELTLTKIALKQNVNSSYNELKRIIEEKKRFASMKDISQLKPHIVFYVLKYMELNDFINSIKTCKAWNYALNRNMYWRLLRRDSIINKYYISSRERNLNKKAPIKRINHAMMSLKIEPKMVMVESGKKNRKKKLTKVMPKGEDIYQACMQQLQKVICQAESDREELRDKVKASYSILKFMETSMYGKMDELSSLNVNKWENKQILKEYIIEKKKLNKILIAKQNELNKHKSIINNLRNMYNNKENNLKNEYKIQIELKKVNAGQQNMALKNELNKLKIIIKKLAKVCLQIKNEIKKKENDIQKFNQRVLFLQQQYTNYTNNNNNNNHTLP